MTDLTGGTVSQPIQPNSITNNEQKSFVSQVSEPGTFSSKISPAMLFAIVALVVVIIEAFFTFILISTANSKLKTQESKITQYTTQINEGTLKATNEQVNQILNGLNVYQQYKNNSVDYASLWSDLSTHTVANVQLKALSIDRKGLVKIDGQATNFSDIANLIASLSKTQSMKNVALISSNSNGQNKDFSLTAHYSPIAAKSVQGSN
jgi:Tfp pilus assembly protein PilN